MTLCDRLDPQRERPHLLFPLMSLKYEERISIDGILDNARTFFELGYKLDDDHLCYLFDKFVVSPVFGWYFVLILIILIIMYSNYRLYGNRLKEKTA